MGRHAVVRRSSSSNLYWLLSGLEACPNMFVELLTRRTTGMSNYWYGPHTPSLHERKFEPLRFEIPRTAGVSLFANVCRRSKPVVESRSPVSDYASIQPLLASTSQHWLGKDPIEKQNLFQYFENNILVGLHSVLVLSTVKIDLVIAYNYI